MRKLLKKLHENTAKTEPAVHESETKEEFNEICDILKKYGVKQDEALCKALINWKFE